MSVFLALLMTAYDQFPDPRAYSPNDTVLFALSDLQSLDPVTQKQCRYLTMANYPAAKRFKATQHLDFILNSLSRRQSMVYCVPVAGSNGSVIRVMIQEYRHGPEGWETLARRGSGPVRVTTKEDQPEPYYSIQLGSLTRKVQRKHADGSPLYYGGDTSKPVYDEVPGGLEAGTWFDITAYRSVQTLTGSSHPLLRADWFIGNVSLNPGYSEFLGIKTLGDFHKLVRFRTEDQDLSGRAVVADSQLVSLHQRGIEFTPKVIGTYWQTYDYLKGSGVNDLLKDPLRRKRDAGEIFAELPNGLQAFALIDGQDKIIDVADGNIVSDQVTPWKNKLVWNGLYSCTNCHKNGAQDIVDEVRPLAAPPRGLITKKHAQFAELVDLYSKNMDVEIANTRARYAQAVLTATRGLKAEENTAGYGALFIEYQQKPLNMATAAAEVGCTPAQLTAILARIIEPDPAVATLLAGRPLRRDLWEVAYPLVATAVWKEIKK